MTHINRRDFHRLSLAATGGWALSSSPVFAVSQDGLTVQRVFGPEIKTGPYKHPACLTELENGDLYLVYYGGAGEYATATAVFGSRLKKGETQWSEPRVIANDPFRSLGNGVVWQAPDKLVWLFYVVRFGDTWSTSRIQAKVSKDNAETWSDSFILALEEGMMVRNRPIVLDNGNYLLPVYQEKAPDTESVGPDSTSLFLLYDVNRKSWQQTERIRSAKGNIQPAVVQIKDDHLVAYCRRGGDYKPTFNGYLVRAESRDGGRTWSEGRDSQFPNPNSAVDFIKLRSGNLLLVYNDHMYQRTPLTAALSTDHDRSYPFRRNIAEGKNSFAYPIALQTRDDWIHVIFTSQQRTVINHAVFKEEWVRAVRSPQRR
ncbi:MAG: exo-alpha-sialidase [Acidobacteriota bacterium]|nr:exo-alpha-sialidase [Acidobacteriota bacterium]